MSSGYKVGDLVWAKMKRFAPWPARIVQPTSSTPKNKKGEKKDHQWVYFFGSKNYSWIESENCLPYLQYKEEMVNSCRTPLFRKAVEQIEEFISKQNEDPNFDLELPPEKTQKEKEDIDEKFNKLISPKKPKKVTPMKRKYSESERSSASKRSRPSTSRMSSPREENGIGDITSDFFNNAGRSLGGSPIFDSNNVSELFNDTEIPTSNLTFGFIGVGNIGAGVVSNLVSAQHKVNLYSRTLDKCEKIMNEHKAGLVKTFITPCDVMQNSDVVFTCVTDSRAAKDIVIGNCGILGREGDCLDGKGYVEMTGIDPETSKDNCEIIKSRGGRYLEAMVQGSKNEADKGNLVVLVAGDRSLFVDCQSCFKAMGKTAFFLGEVGYASKTNLILQLMKGVALVGLAEGLSLADRCGISSKDVLNIFQLTNLACPYLTEKAEMIVKKDFKNVQQAIEHMQKDLKLALDFSDQLKQPLLVTSTANEVYKHGRRLGYDGHDTSCIYMRTRH